MVIPFMPRSRTFRRACTVIGTGVTAIVMMMFVVTTAVPTVARARVRSQERVLRQNLTSLEGTAYSQW